MSNSVPTLKQMAMSLVATIQAGKATLSALRDFHRGNGIRHRDWERILHAHCSTNGRTTEFLNPLLSTLYPPRKPQDVSGLLGHFTISDQKRIVDQLHRDGYYMFENRLPDSVCDLIEQFARNTLVSPFDEFDAAEPCIYEAQNPQARLYKIPEATAATNAGNQMLIADDAFLRIAETYLGTTTVVGGLHNWWSTPYGNGPGSNAAQLFHFDFDAPPRWIKLFVYVTAVGPENGPHIYVKGSHRANIYPAREIISRGYTRIPDQDVIATYGVENTVEITGPRGTVFMADTRGFHKGKHPTGGDRLIGQLMYCSPVFNNHAPKPQPNPPLGAQLAEMVSANPTAYSRYIPS